MAKQANISIPAPSLPEAPPTEMPPVATDAAAPGDAAAEENVRLARPGELVLWHFSAEPQTGLPEWFDRFSNVR